MNNDPRQEYPYEKEPYYESFVAIETDQDIKSHESHNKVASPSSNIYSSKNSKVKNEYLDRKELTGHIYVSGEDMNNVSNKYKNESEIVNKSLPVIEENETISSAAYKIVQNSKDILNYIKNWSHNAFEKEIQTDKKDSAENEMEENDLEIRGINEEFRKDETLEERKKESSFATISNYHKNRDHSNEKYLGNHTNINHMVSHNDEYSDKTYNEDSYKSNAQNESKSANRIIINTVNEFLRKQMANLVEGKNINSNTELCENELHPENQDLKNHFDKLNETFEEINDILDLCDTTNNELDTEFIYYSTLIKHLIPSITNENNRNNIKIWICRLFGPEYQSCLFKEKRNKYLHYIVLLLLNDNLNSHLLFPPPKGALPALESIVVNNIEGLEAEWEIDNIWENIVEDIDTDFYQIPMACSIHKECSTVINEVFEDSAIKEESRISSDTKNPEENNNQCVNTREATIADGLLDSEFRFLLNLAKPFISLLNNTEDRCLAASWIQTLCTIRESSCPYMKGIRNDYMQALLGYLNDLRITGPFREYPPLGSLMPLQEFVNQNGQKYSFANPNSVEANNFLKTQPVLKNGAICFLAVCGDLVDSNILPP